MKLYSLKYTPDDNNLSEFVVHSWLGKPTFHQIRVQLEEIKAYYEGYDVDSIATIIHYGMEFIVGDGTLIVEWTKVDSLGEDNG